MGCDALCEDIDAQGKEWGGVSFFETWREAIKDQGPNVALLGLLLYYFLKLAEKAQDTLVRELRKEIDRMAKSRNLLEKILLKRRRSSDDDLESDDGDDDE